MKTQAKLWLLSLLLSLALPLKAEPLINWQPWQALLHTAVQAERGGQASRVDYGYLASQKSVISQLLSEAAKLDKARFDQASKQEQLAFLINLYNLATVELVLSAYPKLTSIKDLGSILRSPWQQKRIQLWGASISLDDLEHGLIRGSGRYNDPRIHFAVNCASIGCPALRPEAYSSDQLEAQLEQQAKLFLADRSRNRLVGSRLQVSSIFKWYGDDFAKGWRGAKSLNQFLALYGGALGLTPQQTSDLAAQRIEIAFLPYDWGLNQVAGP